MIDESYNTQQLTWTDRSLDAQSPILNIYSPSSSADGSKYLARETMTISAGAVDDVQISLMQYKFTYNFGTGSSSVSAWQTPDNLQDIEGDGSALIFSEQMSAGDFDFGRHVLTVRAVDSAGNEVIEQVIFLVDFCYNDINGTTICEYVQGLEPLPEPVIVEPSFSDPPYIFVWVSSGIAFISIILMLFVIRAGMRGPSRRKSDDDYDDDDWMSEFIGTTQQVDYDSLTNVAPVAETQETKEEEPEEEDPFSVNVVQRKKRRSKPKQEAEPEPEPEEDEAFFGLDDDEFEDEEEAVEEAKPRRKVGRRPAPRNAPKRRPTRRKKSDD